VNEFLVAIERHEGAAIACAVILLVCCWFLGHAGRRGEP
jgi:hypothetical protein